MSVVDREMRAYYERRAREYDDWWLGAGQFAARDRPGWADEVRELTRVVESLPAARVLDVACGTGFLTRHLRGEVAGIDQSETMVAVASKQLPEARIVLGDAVPLPFEDGEFERVFTSHFYGHLLPEERERFLAEARRVAGELVVVDAKLREGVEPEGWPERILYVCSRYRIYIRVHSRDGT